jgi:hypothetical protein
MTNKKTESGFLFTKIKDEQMAEFFENDVILSRININNMEMDRKQISTYVMMIYSSVYPQTEAGKKAIEKEKLQRILDREAKLREKKLRLREKEEEEQRIRQELIQRNEEERAATELAKQKQMKEIEGRYVSFNGKKIDGQFDILLVNENEISITGFRILGDQRCEMNGKIGVLEEYDRNKNVSIANYEDLNQQETCKLKIKFAQYSSSIAKLQKATHYMKIDSRGSCKSYCNKKRSGLFTGRFNKVIK